MRMPACQWAPFPTADARESRGKLRDLARTYFTLGAMQLQINVVD
jgi:hypothetical protein